jgi:polyhydroxybutyrate depolymerase
VTRRGPVAATLLGIVLLAGVVVLASEGPAAAGGHLVLPAVGSAGCATHAAVAPGEQTIPLTVDGQTGVYYQQVPSTYDGRSPLPVVFDLHGYGESASLQVTLTALGTYGQTHGFITITPGDTTTPVPLWETTLDSHDMAFMNQLFDTVEQTLCVNQRRLYVTGYSDGAFMTSAIACRFAGRVAAVAPVAGIQDAAGCHPSRPVPVVAFHGTADPFVHFNGTPSKTAANLPAPTGKSSSLGATVAAGTLLKKGPTIPQETAGWARRNGCRPKATDTRAATGVTLIRYRCPHGADVELYVVKGGGHTWPGSAFSRKIKSVVGFTTFAITANAVMWRFFSAHPLTDAN